MRSAIQTLECAFVVLVGLALVYAVGGCAAGDSMPARVARECAPVAIIAAECAQRREAECPDLKAGECEPMQPCPSCPLLERCDKAIQEACP